MQLLSTLSVIALTSGFVAAQAPSAECLTKSDAENATVVQACPILGALTSIPALDLLNETCTGACATAITNVSQKVLPECQEAPPVLGGFMFLELVGDFACQKTSEEYCLSVFNTTLAAAQNASLITPALVANLCDCTETWGDLAASKKSVIDGVMSSQEDGPKAVANLIKLALDTFNSTCAQSKANDTAKTDDTPSAAIGSAIGIVGLTVTMAIFALL